MKNGELELLVLVEEKILLTHLSLIEENLYLDWKKGVNKRKIKQKHIQIPIVKDWIEFCHIKKRMQTI